MFRRVGAVLLVLLTACSGTPRVTRAQEDEGGAARFGLSVVAPRTVSVEPVELDEDDFTEAVAKLARETRPTVRPQEAARRLFVQVAERGKGGAILRMAPVEVADPTSRAEAELTREYLRWCQRTQGGGDGLRLLTDGPTVRGDDRYALALALSLGSVLDETKLALKGMVEPAAALAMLV